jgi:hypothetical protein
MALLLPLLVILVSGIIDFGGAYRQRTVVQAAARNAARAGATASGLKTVMNGSPVGTRPGAYYADQVALASLVAGLSGSSNITVDKIIIYRANPQADGKPSSGCIAAAAVPGGNGVSGQCNVYTWGQATNAALPTPVFSYGGNGQSSPFAACGTSGYDYRWCTQTRVVTPSTNTVDRLGVYVQARYEPYTSFFTTTDLDITDYSVMAVEPNPRTS